MQDRKGSDPGYLVPGTWYLAPVPNSHISNLKILVVLKFLLTIPSGTSHVQARNHRRTALKGYQLSKHHPSVYHHL